MKSTRAVSTATDVAALVVGAAAAVPAAYLAVVSVAGARLPAPPTGAPHRERRTFAIFVPAHDEQLVIADTLESLRRLDYPPDRFEVFVVADNCTDATADIVRAAGWTVRERRDREHPGKGPALNWLFEEVVASGYDFDTVVVIDADTIVDPQMLHAFDSAMAAGARVVQGHYSVRAPDRSTAAGLRYAALACRHHLRSLGRTRLGGSSGLHGNGMAFDRAIVGANPWTGHLVEDAELQLNLLLERDILVAYAPDAIVRAEMPDTLASSTTQHRRWERGRIDVAQRFIPALAQRFIRRRCTHRVAKIDAAIDLALPPISIVIAAQCAALALSGAATMLGGRRARHAARLSAGALAVSLGHVIIGLRSVRAPRHVYRALLTAPRALIWKVALVIDVARRSDVTWERTERNAERANDGRAS